jgi:hypothetical protein
MMAVLTGVRWNLSVVLKARALLGLNPPGGRSAPRGELTKVHCLLCVQMQKTGSHLSVRQPLAKKGKVGTPQSTSESNVTLPRDPAIPLRYEPERIGSRV